MKITTLCYIEKEEKYLMLHRTKKKQDPNEGKWIGVGGHLGAGESPEDCLVREVLKERPFPAAKGNLHGFPRKKCWSFLPGKVTGSF